MDKARRWRASYSCYELASRRVIIGVLTFVPTINWRVQVIDRSIQLNWVVEVIAIVTAVISFTSKAA
jgi:hypothetical protein